MIITTSIESLKACLPFVSKDETRYYLRGVFFTGQLLVATNGHQLAAVKPAFFEGEAQDFILPTETCVALSRVKPFSKHLQLFVSIDTEKKTVSAVHRDEKTGKETILVSFPFAPVDGTFPDWRRVIPSEESFTQGAPAGFNSGLLSDFKAFGRHIAVYLNSRPSSPSIIRAETDAFDALGVLMPVGQAPDQCLMPAWLQSKKHS